MKHYFALSARSTGSGLRLALAATCFAPLVVGAQPAATPADVFQRLNADKWISRTVTLADLGFAGPLVLGAPETTREVYLPVPANVPLSAAEIKLNANYMRADGGRTTLVASLDSYPVLSRGFALEKGDASQVIGVDGAPRPSGFVRLGLNWGTALGAEWMCSDGRTQGNVLRVEPDSRFTYRYDSSAIRDLTTAWGALPAVPVILVSSKNLTSPAYDSAWRMGAALERAGKRSRILAFPSVGDTVDLDGVTIPQGLSAITAFANLGQGGKYKLKDAAELGALLSLGSSGPFRADIVIADKAMSAAMAAALDAVNVQLRASAPDAAAAYGQWRTASLEGDARPDGAKEVRLASMFGRPVIVVGEGAGAKAAGLFSSYWDKIATSPLMIVQAADAPSGDASAVSLKYLGGKPGSFEVLGNADWIAAFDIGAVAANGRLPATLVLDVAASPSAARTPPVATVFLNDVLLGARQLEGTGKAERITAPVPCYSLAARNVLRVSFTRQLASDRCRETPTAYPVSVLPSSHLLLDKVSASDDFTGMVSRYAAGAHVIVPASYLADAEGTLPRVVRLAATTGVSPVNATFTAVNGNAIPAPGGPFLAIAFPLKEGDSKVKVEGGRVVMASNDNKVFLDVTGLNSIGIIEVAKVGGETGVTYRGVGTQPPNMTKAMLLAEGNVAVVGSNGLISEINTADPGGRSAKGDPYRAWMLTAGYWWWVPVLVVVFIVSLLVFASRTRRRRVAEKVQR